MIVQRVTKKPVVIPQGLPPAGRVADEEQGNGFSLPVIITGVVVAVLKRFGMVGF